MGDVDRELWYMARLPLYFLMLVREQVGALIIDADASSGGCTSPTTLPSCARKGPRRAESVPNLEIVGTNRPPFP
jgi:hypothetical protein